MGIEKRTNRAAIIKGATWGTAAQAGAAGCGITPMNMGVPQLSIPTVEIDDIRDAAETDIDQANINPADFALDFQYQWSGLENILLALLMGTAGAPTQQAATAAYLHVLALKDSASGLFVTYACDKGAKVHVVPSAKVMKFVLGMANGMIKANFSLRGNTVTDADAVVTALTSVTYPEIHIRAKMNQAVFRINAQAGDALAVGDKVVPKNFSFEIERKFDAEHGAGSQTIIEPIENSKISVKFMMEFSRLDTAGEAFMAAWLAGTEKKADLTITGPLIASTYYHYLKIEMPRLRVEQVEYPDGNINTCKVTFRALVADAAPTGMTALTRPVQISIMSKRTTDLLA